MRFEILAQDPLTAARVGRLTLPHGVVETPVFMPVGTQATVKALRHEDLEAADVSIILANAYHLYLRPGVEVLRAAGGLHRFMSWNRPILTDSGGFQVFSLAALRKISEEGVHFQSHIDGSRHFFTPERVIEIQETIGADIIMCLDECTHYPVSYGEAKQSLERTARWAERCYRYWEESTPQEQALFGIIQGSVYEDLRRYSVELTAAFDFPGFAIGGVSVGETREEMYQVMRHTAPLLPEHKPRYLMGVGPPEDFLEGIEWGIDLFDCVMPTRNARNGSLFTSQGKINIKNAQYVTDFRPPDPGCHCPVCRRFTRAYLSHLYRSREILALHLNSLHNVYFMVQLAAQARAAIRSGAFREFKEAFLRTYLPSDSGTRETCT